MGQRFPRTFAMIKKSMAAILVALAFVGGQAVAADALQPSTSTRGTIKVRPRYFNPFDVQRNRLRIDPFGFFTLLPASPVIGAPTAVLTSSAAAATPAATTTANNPPAAASATDDSSTITTTAPPVSKSFRPDPRSPFRPPTRPPFM